MSLNQSRIVKELFRVRLSLRTLDKALRRLTPLVASGIPAQANGGKPAVGVSPKVQAARVLQGRYMGYMRQLKPKQKAQVRRIRETKGVKAAIGRARGLTAAP